MRRMMLGIAAGLIASAVWQVRRSGTMFGEVVIDRDRLRRAGAEGSALREMVVGVARIADDVTPDLAAGTIEHLTVVGTLLVPAGVDEALHGRLSVVGSIVVRQGDGGGDLPGH